MSASSVQTSKLRVNRKTGAPVKPFWQVLKNNGKMLAKVFRFTPLYAVIKIISQVIIGLVSVMFTYFTYDLLNQLDAGISLEENLYLILQMVAVWVFCGIYSGVIDNIVTPILSEKLLTKIHLELFKKAECLDLACYDDPAFYNDFVFAMEKAGHRGDRILNDLTGMIRQIVSVSGMMTLAFTIHPIAAVIMLAGAMWKVLYRVYENRWRYKSHVEEMTMMHKNEYIGRVFNQPDYAKEVRVPGVTEMILKDGDDNTRDIIDVEVKWGKKRFALGILDVVMTNASEYGVLIFLIWQMTCQSRVGLGGLAAAVTLVWKVERGIVRLIMTGTKFQEHSLYLDKYFGFLYYKPHIVTGEKDVPEFDSLVLNDVSFTYDFSDNPVFEFHKTKDIIRKSEPYRALKHISLEVNKGQKIAIVGYNGAGKTTLIKLLMRLYDPTEGTVTYNGVPISQYRLEEYRNHIGVVFQDYRIFAASVAENVMGGVYHAETDEAIVRKALTEAGFDDKLQTMPDGIDTGLTREFDRKGTNLSGGEAQKVAIARVFARPYELIIMDEPSSALDPVAEYNLNCAIATYCKDKAVIFISHRLSTTRDADCIYMFANGELIEKGTHDELMNQKGKYCEMFNLQAEAYVHEA